MRNFYVEFYSYGGGLVTRVNAINEEQAVNKAVEFLSKNIHLGSNAPSKADLKKVELI
jgi:hypothetical protein